MAIIYIDIYKNKHNCRTLTQPHNTSRTRYHSTAQPCTTSKLSTTALTNIYINHSTLHTKKQTPLATLPLHTTARINHSHTTTTNIHNSHAPHLHKDHHTLFFPPHNSHPNKLLYHSTQHKLLYLSNKHRR